MKIGNSQALRAWLEEKLSHLCEADPAALSKYVMALIQKDKELDELKHSCSEQLEVFLGTGTDRFVEGMFSAISNESYLPKETAAVKAAAVAKETENEPDLNSDKGSTPRAMSPASGPTSPVPHRRERERRHTDIDDDDRDFKRGRRHSSSDSSSPDRTAAYRPSAPVSTSSSSGVGRGASIGGGEANKMIPGDNKIINLKQKSTWRNSGRQPQQQQLPLPLPVPMPMPPGNFNPFPPQPPMRPLFQPNFMKPPMRKERCKDFDEKGVCMLGEGCPYDHGNDPLVVGTMLPPWANSAQNSNNMTTMPQQLRGLSQPRMPNLPNFPPRPLLPGGFPLTTPPLMSTSTADSGMDNGYNPENPGMRLGGLGGMGGLGGLIHQHQHHHHGMPPGLISQLPLLPGGPGVRPFVRGINNKRPRIPTDCLLVKNVPPEKNSITTLSNHFQQFGTIINIRVRFQGDPHSSLVQFSSTEEAQKAFGSSEAVLGNRFIKLFFFKSNDSSAPHHKRRKEEIFDVTSGVQLLLDETRGDAGPASRLPSSAISASSSHPPSYSSPPSLSFSPSLSGSVSPATYTSAFAKVSKMANVGSASRSPLLGPSSASSTPTVGHSTVGVFRTAPAHKTSSVTWTPGGQTVRGPPPPPALPPQDRALLAKQASVSKKIASLQKQLEVLQEWLNKKTSLQSNVKGLVDKQLDTQKMLIGKLESSKSLPEAERKKVMETLKEMAGSASKQIELTQVLKTAILKLNKEKQTVESALSEAEKDLKALKEAEVENHKDSQQQPSPLDKNDLRNRIAKKRLLVMDVDVEDHLKLAKLFESAGSLLEVALDPDNSRNLIFTFSKRADAEQAVRSITSFNSKPVIMKWYTPPIQVLSQEVQSEVELKVATVAKQLSEVAKVPSTKPVPKPLNLERRKSEIDDLLLLSPGMDSPTLLLTPGGDGSQIIDDSLLDD